VTTYTLTVVGPMVGRRGKPPKPGWLSSNDRHAHWAQRSKLTAQWRQAAYKAMLAAHLPRLNRVRIVATALVPNARLRDSNNLEPTAKACIDGIRDHTERIADTKVAVQLRGCLPDDNTKHVVGPDMRMRIDRSVQLPTIELTIIDLEAGDHGPA
jgi:hypothetical protein